MQGLNRISAVTAPPAALIDIDRAITDLRRGGVVALRDEKRAFLAEAAEAITAESLARLASAARERPSLILTRRRAAALRLAGPPRGPAGAMRVALPPDVTAAELRDLADPQAISAVTEGRFTAVAVEPRGAEAAAVDLAKLARLLPAAVVVAVDPAALAGAAARHHALVLEAGHVFAYQATVARSLVRVAEAKVPLADAERTRIIAFRPSDGGIEHLAIVIGDPPSDRPVLARIHSECFTGDLLGSLRCDCGDQLRGAIREIAAAGGGVLLYLAQEGRGIGLVNKLRAYQLQDAGYDTIDANEQLGFDADERVYLPAAAMLRQLGFGCVRLLTNNPEKVSALQRCGIEVAERVPHVFPANGHNERYLRTKATRSGHLL
ncbi:MAG: GTP cyclohydrolase II [Rhodospirillales bacterium]|nr:GTP cyclohydrolase II [Rhodospirillales bacterium]